MIYCFGRYQIDTETCELYQDGSLRKVENRAFEILSYLIEHRDHIVSREELVGQLWPGQLISQAVVNNAITAARKAIGDSGGDQHKIRTLHGRGYRFVAEARTQPLTAPQEKDPPRPNGQTPPLTENARLDPGSASQNVLVGDYRFVTILCGALEWPASLSVSMPFAAAQRLRRRFFALAQAEAKRHNAAFKYFGPDGFFMVVGLPLAHADHGRRAMASGLYLQAHLGECCVANKASASLHAGMRLSMHSGPIELRSPLHHHEWMPLAASEAVARALWLHQQAEGGQFLCSASALAHVREPIECVEHGVIPIPEPGQPIKAYRILGRSMSPPETH